MCMHCAGETFFRLMGRSFDLDRERVDLVAIEGAPEELDEEILELEDVELTDAKDGVVDCGFTGALGGTGD